MWTRRFLLLDAVEHRHLLIVHDQNRVLEKFKDWSAMEEQDRKRRRALIVFQVWIYGMLLTMFLIQLSMLLTRNW